MPSIASRPKFISTTPRQIAAAFIILAVVASLFLVPEIDWEAGEEGLVGAFFNSEKGEGAEELRDEDTSVNPVVRRTGALEGVLELLNSKPAASSITQTNLPLKARKRESLRIANKLPDKARASKKALKRYASELEKVSAGKDAADLQKLAIAATAELAKENAPQELRVRWAKISGVNDSGISDIYNGKAKSDGGFAPSFRLSRVWARQGYQHHGVWDPTARVTVKIRGFIEANNLARVLVFINGTFSRPLDIRKTEDGSGRRRFFFKQSENLRNSVITFRMVSKDGQFYDRSYSFYPRVTRFTWNGHSTGTFEIPWGVDDPRMDRYFFVGHSGQLRKASVSKGGGAFGGARHFESW